MAIIKEKIMSGKLTSLQREIVKAKGKLRPLIVVEGNDDPNFYEKILYEISPSGGKAARIMPISVLGRGAGCGPIIDQFQEIQEWLGFDLMQFVKGIIDRDSFYYIADSQGIQKRNAIKGLLILRYYSFESHFITKKAFKDLINKITTVELSKIDDNILEYFFENLKKNVFDDFYYIGLECLRNGLEKQYTAFCGYDRHERDIGNLNKCRNTVLKNIDRPYLDGIAQQKNIRNCIEDIKKIVKGKHLLYGVAFQMAYILEQLEKKCNVLPCIYMNESCSNESCRWKNKGKYTADQIYYKLQETLDVEEVNYIIDEFKNLNIELKPHYISA